MEKGKREKNNRKTQSFMFSLWGRRLDFTFTGICILSTISEVFVSDGCVLPISHLLECRYSSRGIECFGACTSRS